MPNDAKLGLVAGVGLVIVVAVIFFHRDLAATTPFHPEQAATSVNPDVPVPPPAPRSQFRQAKARTMTRITPAGQSVPVEMRHTIREGDTLSTLAQRYYADGSQATVIFEANRDVLKTPDALTPGTAITIPALEQ